MTRARPEDPRDHRMWLGLVRQRDSQSLAQAFVSSLCGRLDRSDLRLYLRARDGLPGSYHLMAGEPGPADQRCLERLAQADGSAPDPADPASAPLYWKIAAEGRTIGLLLLNADNPLASEFDFLESALAIYAHLHILLTSTTLDGLTGLFNRRAFESHMNRLLSGLRGDHRRADRQGLLPYFALLDIDNFKAVNDRLGHLIGDEVLLHFSQLMTRSFRADDLLFRYGGEEFAIALFVDRPEHVGLVLERFRYAVEEYLFPGVGPVTVSIGFTNIKANQVLTTVTDEADRALYFAKRNGRNRIADHDALIEAGALEAGDGAGTVELFY